jgi:hypothetical protein
MQIASLILLITASLSVTLSEDENPVMTDTECPGLHSDSVWSPVTCKEACEAIKQYFWFRTYCTWDAERQKSYCECNAHYGDTDTDHHS